MSVLILKNTRTEGPGTIGDFLKANNILHRVVELENEDIPDAEGFDTLVMLGGPMSANDTSVFSYIKKEEELVRKFAQKNKKILGICLGAQIMAKAFGAKVYKGTKPEIGWHYIEITETGIRDCYMKKLAIHPKAGDFWKQFKVFHWHGETFDIPCEAQRLAKSALYPNQAFRLGTNAYAFQFHIEVTKDMVYDWFSTTGEPVCAEKNEIVDLKNLFAETELLYETYLGRATNFYKDFFKLN